MDEPSTIEAARRLRLFESILANTSDLVCVFDTKGRIAYANAALTRALGAGWEALAGRTLEELGCSRAQTELIGEQIRDVATSNRAVRRVGTFVVPGSDRVYDYTLAPVCSEGANVELISGTAREVTEEQRAQAQLQQSDRRKEEFIALLAHELRNPLAPLRNGIEMLKLAPHDLDTVVKARSLMDRQLSHLVRLIDDLLDVSRITRNRLELRRKHVLLADVVADAVDAARPLVLKAGHTLETALPREPVTLYADEMRLSQVLLNLLSNAVKYTERGGTIELSARRLDDAIEIAVADTGRGLAAEDISQIFDMFAQVKRGAGPVGGGLGIGLALVKGLVEMHGGSVRAESAGPGQGSRFTVRLPLPASGTSSGAPEPSVTAGGRGARKRRVLVVDDNEDLLTSTAWMIERLGHEVFTARDGVEALEVAERQRPDVIFMDIGMPRLDGLEAVRRLRRTTWGKEMAVVALTGWGQAKDRAASGDAGCQAHLVKPIALDDVRHVLRDLAATNEYGY